MKTTTEQGDVVNQTKELKQELGYDDPIKDKGECKTIPLPIPIIKEDKTLNEVVLSKPHAGHLRGVSLYDVCNADFDTGRKIIPRISELDERDMLNMETENWAPLLTGLASFFVNTEA